MDEKELAALKESNPKAYEFITNQKTEIEKLKAAPPPKKEDPPPPKKEDPPGDDPDLREKVRRDKEAQESKKQEIRQLEGALKFNLGVAAFIKENEDVLPAAMSAILQAADKETYDSAVERANVVKSQFIQEFFSVQANVDLLTPAQKTTLSDYLKLTKNGKEQKAESLYENLFEPALGMLKKLKKAEDLGKARSGYATGSKVDDDYKARLIASTKPQKS